MSKTKYRVWKGGIKKMSWVSQLLFNGTGTEIIFISDGGRTAEYENKENYLESIVLMQYIGLKDNNNKEIYKGDVVKKGDGLLYEMKSRDDFARFEFMSIHKINDGNRKWSGIYGYPHKFNEPEPEATIGKIIGNIYENPELITN